MLHEWHNNQLLLQVAEGIVYCEDLREYGAGQSEDGMDLD